jgi:hypothetical protein
LRQPLTAGAKEAVAVSHGKYFGGVFQTGCSLQDKAEHFKVGKGLLSQNSHGFGDALAAVVCRDDHADLGILRRRVVLVYAGRNDAIGS